MGEEITTLFTRLGGEIVSTQAFREGDQDFRAILTAIRPTNPTAIFVPNMWRENTLIARQAQELGMRVDFISGDTFSDDMFEIMPDLDNFYAVQHFAWEDPNVQEILHKYWNRFGGSPNLPQLNVIMGYDMVSFIANRIETAGSTDPEAIRQAIVNSRNVRLAHSYITMNPDNHNPLNKAAVVMVLRNGQQNYYETFIP